MEIRKWLKSYLIFFSVVLYYGVTCPHCKIVEEWLNSQPDIKEKSRLETKEVYQNKNNSKELVEKA